MSFGILDNVMVDGWSAVQRIAIALLRLHEETLIKAKDIGYVDQIIKSMSSSEEYSHNLL